MIRLAGKHPGRDIEIVYTGLRPGEKLHETVFHPEERHAQTANPHDPAGGAARRVTHIANAVAQLRERLDTHDSSAAHGCGSAVPEFLRETRAPDYRHRPR